MGEEVAEAREPGGAGGVLVWDITGGAGFFAGGEESAVGGIGVVDAGEFAGDGDLFDFAGDDFLLVEVVVGDDFGREGREGVVSKKWQVASLGVLNF